MQSVWRAVSASLLACVAILAAGSATAAPLEAYGRLPTIEDVQISGDGTLLAVILTDGDKRSVVIKRLADDKIVGGLNAGTQKVRDVSWAGSRYLITTITQTAAPTEITGPRREYAIAIVYDIVSGKQRGLMDNASGSMNTVLGPPRIRQIDGELYALVEGVNFVDSQGRVGVFRVRLKDGQTKLVEPGYENTNDWVIGQDGQAIAQTEYDQKTGRWQLRLREGRAWKVVSSGVYAISYPSLAGLGRDGKSALLIDSDDTHDVILREYAPGGATPAVVSTEPFDHLIHDPSTRALMGDYALIGDEDRYRFFDPKAAAVWKGVSKAFPGARVRLVSWSDDRQLIVVFVDSKTQGPAYFMIDMKTRKAVWLGDVYAGLKEADIAEVRPLAYKAADGLAITGYLTLPKGKEAKGLPLIVMPHGGPASRDEPGFDYWAQALASRGYAVLQPNFRGSEGLGLPLLEAGYGEFGRKMQTDLSDGVRHLAAQGVIDPKRVCIAGASYGGYAALAGPTLDPGVYRCAAAVAGISDLKKFMDSRVQLGGPRDNSAIRYWSRFLGVEGRKDPDLAAISPARFADKVTVPILLIHGKDDTVVLYNQSTIMADALKKAGKPVELVTLKAEDHWLSRGETRLQMLTSLVAFLEKHNPPD